MMTNKEAVETLREEFCKLKLFCELYPDACQKENCDIYLAIEVLKGKDTVSPSIDTISRQAAIDAIEKAKTAKSEDGEIYVAKYNAEMNITLLPSTQPGRKKGRWNFIGDQMFECTECGVCYTQSQFDQMRVRITDSISPNFCPNCGADMKGKQDE